VSMVMKQVMVATVVLDISIMETTTLVAVVE
jgi:hypothetical protein